MKAFIHDDFVLTSDAAKTLYHQYAKEMPIHDFHCHLSPKEIAENKSFNNISEIWLHGDHYKWRAMRILGVDEELITGNASDFDKFQAWAKTVPYTIGNPLYQWTHLELKRYFNVEQLLNEQSAEEIWHHCNALLQQEDYTTQKIIEKSNVNYICTTDDPVDTLEHHHAIAANPAVTAKVLPTFRPDKAVEINRPEFSDYMKKLSEAAQMEITSYDQLLHAIEKRAAYFHEAGCRVSDHGIQTLPFAECTHKQAAAIFNKRMSGTPVSAEEEEKYKSFTLLFLGRLYSSLGWVMQLHIGAIRNNNQRRFQELGPDTGFDSIHDFELAAALNGFLNALDSTDELPKAIIYNLNPVHNHVIATAIGNFQSSGIRGKIQFGSGWWFLDQKDGMTAQMKDLANFGILSAFVGMLTDSRSFLSYTRHEYFRRILCDFVGGWIENGEAPKDYVLTGKIIQDICYNNAKNYFGI
ncbi:glucuronate isomerase [Evansella caseinilytica]|uniref:Uronate isomerase n=1 Tax=Evansella caseinilytica TaxID=1503961 RepID=A0A1H3NXL9_9BACI|nr:glucuronate isomerase [Evansella caseinilytica]SDY93285.1 glucuronate isomerase [Evansella caseinilytica]